jgi:hypothetical protein
VGIYERRKRRRRRRRERRDFRCGGESGVR